MLLNSVSKKLIPALSLALISCSVAAASVVAQPKRTYTMDDNFDLSARVFEHRGDGQTCNAKASLPFSSDPSRARSECRNCRQGVLTRSFQFQAVLVPIENRLRYNVRGLKTQPESQHFRQKVEADLALYNSKVAEVESFETLETRQQLCDQEVFKKRGGR